MYINPRLKHVKEIMRIINRQCTFDVNIMNIRSQCNLLLETKKAKKRKRRHWFKPDVFGDMRCRFCRKHFSQKIEGEWVKRFEEELVEMSLFKGRDMHNRPPLYDMTNDKVEEIKSFISNLLASERQRCVEASKELSECLSEAIDLMEDVRDGEYKPDSFTTQPWRKAIDQAKHNLEQMK